MILNYEENMNLDTLESEQQLDAIYHAIPEWIHREFSNLPLAEKVKRGFEHQQKVLTDIYLKQVEDYNRMRDFSSWMVKIYNSEFFKDYWEFLVSKGIQKDEIGVLTAVKNKCNE